MSIVYGKSIVNDFGHVETSREREGEMEEIEEMERGRQPSVDFVHCALVTV